MAFASNLIAQTTITVEFEDETTDSLMIFNKLDEFPNSLLSVEILKFNINETEGSAPFFLSGDYKIANNTFKGSTVAIEPTGITNVVSNTSDSFGNILI